MGLGKGLVGLVKRWWTLTNQLESEALVVYVY